jgi:hypothetical protein
MKVLMPWKFISGLGYVGRGGVFARHHYQKGDDYICWVGSSIEGNRGLGWDYNWQNVLNGNTMWGSWCHLEGHTTTTKEAAMKIVDKHFLENGFILLKEDDPLLALL